MKQKLAIALIFFVSITLSACDNDSVNDSANANSGEFDTQAIQALDDLADVIGEMDSTSFTLVVADSEQSGDDGWHTTNRKSDVYMRGPDKFYIHTVGENLNKGLWYNGSELAKFSFANNTYDSVPVSGSIIEAIDYIHNEFGVDFPAADFFYPTFTDDMMADFDSIFYMGEEAANDMTYLLIEASNENQFVTIWIDKSTNLPSKFEVFSNGNKHHYSAQFSNWKINPGIGEVVFDFLPPSGSEKAPLMVKE